MGLIRGFRVSGFLEFVFGVCGFMGSMGFMGFMWPVVFLGGYGVYTGRV